MKLDATTLPAFDLPKPTYDRTEIGVGIVHFGVGGFHRAHQAAYLDELMNQGRAREWGICGVGVLPGDRRMAEALTAQDGLYTLLVEHPDGTRSARIIGSLVDYRYAPDDPESVLEILAAPTTRIVSLTITEGGYEADSPDTEISVFGLLTEALARRRARGVPAPTVMSCDNIENNGAVARRALIRHAERVDPELAAWIEAEVRFPSSMVDRITPVTTESVIDAVAGEFGVDDRWPVVAEPYTAWVLEDDFADGRPPLDAAGVLLVDDVTPYELMKLRLLNAGHQSLCYFAYLAGYRLVHDAAVDPLFAEFLDAYMEFEATPTLLPVPGIDLTEYRRTLLRRFANPGIADTIARLCAWSSDRIPQWLLPVIRANLASGGSIRLAAATVAAWARYAEGIDEQGDPIEVVDQLADQLIPLARTQRTDPTAFIDNTALFGDLGSDPRFTEAYVHALNSLHHHGACATLAWLLDKETA
ncbi:mannitol dehydrogenase family protein [Nocardia sp. NPDC058176]|uniref:mannitol dehydrogenase family protein n=1 Tax=Nocardia sp. NPDC058176 TaxID=3346368 RepID=UPI0036DC5508